MVTRLLEHYNDSNFIDVSRRNTINTTSKNRPKQKYHGKKSKTTLYEEMCLEAGMQLRMDEFGKHWLGKDSPLLEEYKRLLIEKYGAEGPFPKIDEEIYSKVIGPPTRGRWVGVPFQIAHPELFEAPRESELEETNRRQAIELRDLRRAVYQIEHNNENERAEAKARWDAWQADQARSSDASISSMWEALVKNGHVSRSDVPVSLVAGSSHTLVDQTSRRLDTTHFDIDNVYIPSPPRSDQQMPPINTDLNMTYNINFDDDDLEAYLGFQPKNDPRRKN